MLRRYKKFYVPCVFIKLPITYNKGRKGGKNEWIKSESANLSPNQENQET